MNISKFEKLAHRWLLILGAISCAGAGWYLFTGIRDAHNSIKAVKEENYTLNLQVANLKLLSDETSLLLRLEEELITHSGGKLGNRLPYVAVKLIEQTKLYRADGLEMSLLLAIIEVESGFDPRATSPSGAYGLMQTVRSTAKPILALQGREFSPEILYNPEVSIEVGTAFLVDLHRGYMARKLEDVYDWHLSIDAYFWGERWVYESLSGASSSRNGFASRSYWNKVRSAQTKWRERGF